ncbi:hypothetical protein [Serratia marcescens]|uniref:hypothetical protein n=1 Tax=Serratia marcescens TaxID=615 RepID=UPI000AAFAF81|nr:hypothetical protein [Serratia marcescens]
MSGKSLSAVICICMCMQIFSCAYAVRCDYSSAYGKLIIATQIDSYNGHYWVTTDGGLHGQLYLVQNYYPDYAREMIRMAQMAKLLDLKVDICYRHYSVDYDELYTLMLN